MYKVVNRDWNQSLPEIFDTFMDAFVAQQKWDKTAVIECHYPDDDSVDVVWEREYENIFFLDNARLNTYT